VAPEATDKDAADIDATDLEANDLEANDFEAIEFAAEIESSKVSADLKEAIDFLDVCTEAFFKDSSSSSFS